MTLLIILIFIFSMSVIGAIKSSQFSNLNPICILIAVIFGTYLAFHLLLMFVSVYEYNSLIAKREAIVSTLDYARKNNSSLELASITREIIDFNKNLAKAKYQNSTFFLGDYVDDRIVNIEPIK